MERDLLLVATVEVGLCPLVINLKITSPRITFMPTNIDSSKKINTRFCCFLVDVSVSAVEVDCYCHYLQLYEDLCIHVAFVKKKREKVINPQYFKWQAANGEVLARQSIPVWPKVSSNFQLSLYRVSPKNTLL